MFLVSEVPLYLGIQSRVKSLRSSYMGLCPLLHTGLYPQLYTGLYPQTPLGLLPAQRM